jgi:hypothetical protein
MLLPPAKRVPQRLKFPAMFIEEPDTLLVTNLKLSGTGLACQIAGTAFHPTQLYLWLTAAIGARHPNGDAELSDRRFALLCHPFRFSC